MNHKMASFSAVRLIAFAIFCGTTPSVSWSAGLKVVGMDQGFLFIDGHYVSAPYDIQLTDDGVSINGQSYAKDYFVVPGSTENSGDRHDRMEWGGRMSQRGMPGDGSRWSRGSNPMARIVDQLGNAQ
ncbi:MAG: hypothetical protein WBD20_00170, partial [Pirellulaceae bacterium]